MVAQEVVVQVRVVVQEQVVVQEVVVPLDVLVVVVVVVVVVFVVVVVVVVENNLKYLNWIFSIEYLCNIFQANLFEGLTAFVLILFLHKNPILLLNQYIENRIH